MESSKYFIFFDIFKVLVTEYLDRFQQISQL